MTTLKQVSKRQALYAQIVDQAIIEKQLRKHLEAKRQFREFFIKNKGVTILNQNQTAEQNQLTLRELILLAHGNACNKGFWDDEDRIISGMKRANIMAKDRLEYPIFCPEDIEAIQNAFLCQRLMLIVSEIAESVEALRAGDQKNFREEIADVLIRLGDIIGGIEQLFDIQQDIIEKMRTNELRPAKHGKKF